jgi:2-polyprenyl-3-methyl-5-hydroxy-6-metoxy-1,4-benzoquinol methylase
MLLTCQEFIVDRAEQVDLTRRFFDEVASGWTTRYVNDAAVGARKSRFYTAIQASYSQPADILDFGCGSGDIALHLARAGHRLTGYDLSSVMIAQARQSDRDSLVRWIAATADRADGLPFAGASFDGVVTSSVLEYVPELDMTLRELARVLRPHGRLFATVPDMRNPRRRRERWLQRALAIPGMAGLLARSRWREGAAYLRISTNRIAPLNWQSRLRACGLSPEDLPNSTDPLMLLVARKV